MKNLLATAGIALTSFAWVWTGSSCGFGAAQNSQSGGKAMASSKADPLKNFYLVEEIKVSGLTPSAALDKVRVSYEQLCSKTGEKPLKLAFELPPGPEKPLRVKLEAPRTLDNSVRVIAAAAEMTVERDGSTYRFKAPRVQENGELVKETFSVPPDFVARLGEKGNARDVRSALTNFGIDLDDSTRFSLTGSKLSMETRSAGDVLAVSSAIAGTIGDLPVQFQMQAQVFEIPAGSKWTAPSGGGFDEKTAKRLLKDLERSRGVKVQTIPSITTRQYEVGLCDWSEDTRSPMGGKVLRMQAGSLGGGHLLKTSYSDTAGRTNGGKHVHIEDAGYAPDFGTRLSVQTLPDGSRVAVAVTPVLIDATGKPVRKPERKLAVNYGF
ncbi:hypothetical protein [Haloferula sp. BvORR071]|uniref:hypothetical protein n=1 Tax=Haloferula sp. BvORR071 TaxID=1396141 RepID=UPI00054F6DF7|nr:hypothetical protein [Haloferula sp. BvORR071]